MIEAYQRADGRKGIRNVLAVVYLVECAHHVARSIVYSAENEAVHLIGFPGCYPNDYSAKVMAQLCTHPNVGGVLLVSLGCEGFNKRRLMDAIEESGRPVELLIIQNNGGTKATITTGKELVGCILDKMNTVVRVPMDPSELVIGTVCGGSDGTSGITANPAVGYAFDRFVADGATCIFEETGELIGCEREIEKRAATPELAEILTKSIEKAARYYTVLGAGSFAPGNADGGLTTQEEKSLGSYAKSGSAKISGLLKPGDLAPEGGLYLLDVVPDGEVRFGFPNISDNAEIVELMACGAHITLFTTGRGSVVGSAISPVIKICANPDTYEKLADDMDVNAGKVLTGESRLTDVGNEIYDLALAVAAGKQSKSELLGHQEFILTYKSFEPIGPSCLPNSARSFAMSVS